MAICDKDGKLLLSWRLVLLPYVEQEKQYRKFKLNESWDNAINQKNITKIPAYERPGRPANSGETFYRCFVGPKTLYPNTKPAKNDKGFAIFSKYRYDNIPDGTSNTIFVAEAADPVVWPKPNELKYDPKKPLPKLGDASLGYFLVAMADGSNRVVSNLITEKTLRYAIEANDGMTLGNDW